MLWGVSLLSSSLKKYGSYFSSEKRRGFGAWRPDLQGEKTHRRVGGESSPAASRCSGKRSPHLNLALEPLLQRNYEVAERASEPPREHREPRVPGRNSTGRNPEGLALDTSNSKCDGHLEGTVFKKVGEFLSTSEKYLLRITQWKSICSE